MFELKTVNNTIETFFTTINLNFFKSYELKRERKTPKKDLN